MGSSGRRWIAVALWAAVGGALAASWAFAHLCNNIYRTPDRVVVKPEKPVATVVGNEQFRVFVQNNYPTYLDNLRLAAKVDAPGVTVSVAPEAIKRLKAGERSSFQVKLTARPDAPKGRHALSFSISADNIGWRPVAEVTTADLRAVVRKNENLSCAVQAAESLVARHDPEGAKYLTQLAGDPKADRDYRARFTRALGKGGDRANIPFLRTLLKDRDGWVQGNALLALGLLGDDAKTFAPFYTDRDEFVRASASAGRLLAGGRERNLVQTTTQNLKASNPYVRIASGWALAAANRDKAAIAVLDQAFTTDDAQQRVTAGDALVNVANRRG